MISLPIDRWNSVVCLGAHADDIEIGCGGTLLHMMKRNPKLDLHWHLFSGDETREKEAKQSAEEYFQKLGEGRGSFQNHRFQDAHFPSQLNEIKKTMQGILQEAKPDVVFVHQIHDRHQDHRTLGEVAWQTFRNHCILEYEIPKYEGDLPHPNVFVPISEDDFQTKVSWLGKCFPTQSEKPWYDEDTFRALVRLRGLECHSESRYAEAFTVRKMILY